MSVLTTKQLHGVVFDMDGTLTVPCLDFMKLRKQLCINKNIDILAHVDSLVGNEKDNAMKTIEAFEEEGRKSLELQPGIEELFTFLLHETSLRPKLALVTRNNTLAVKHFLEKCATDNVCADAHELFSIILTRDFKPVKPHPAALLHIASKWDTDPNNIIIVGDDKHDILCGKSAGAMTVLLNNEKNEAAKELAEYNVDKLTEIIPILKTFMMN
eukprot:gene6002-11370_t